MKRQANKKLSVLVIQLIAIKHTHTYIQGLGPTPPSCNIRISPMNNPIDHGRESFSDMGPAIPVARYSHPRTVTPMRLMCGPNKSRRKISMAEKTPNNIFYASSNAKYNMRHRGRIKHTACCCEGLAD